MTAAVPSPTWGITVEIDGVSKPACVAEFITRHYFRPL